MIDRGKVRQAFGRGAAEYDTHAVVQKRVIARFVELLKREDLAPRRLLDIGAGTGVLLRSLRELYGHADAVGIDLSIGMSRTARENLAANGSEFILTADAEQLPFVGASFDLALSTSTFQWLVDLKTAFGEVFRVLAPGGAFCFALFGGQTLHELRTSYRLALTAAGCQWEDRSHTFFTENEVTEALTWAGFGGCRVVTEFDIEMHDNVPSLLRSLKRIGAGSASPITLRGLAGKRVMLDMMETYRREFSRPLGMPATYEVLYGVARKNG